MIGCGPKSYSCKALGNWNSGTGIGSPPSFTNCITSTYSPAGYSTSPSVTSTLYNAYKAFKDQLVLTRTNINHRITEISNRIGYVNGRDVADGGTEAKSSGYNTTNGGFAGYSFNGGAGYANTIYAHCNFLAGKKIKLLEKILGAVEDVDALYDQIKTKRAEYYEYNQ